MRKLSALSSAHGDHDRAALIERIQDEIAALGPVEFGDVLGVGIEHHGAVPPRASIWRSICRMKLDLPEPVLPVPGSAATQVLVESPHRRFEWRYRLASRVGQDRNA